MLCQPPGALITWFTLNLFSYSMIDHSNGLNNLFSLKSRQPKCIGSRLIDNQHILFSLLRYRQIQ